MIVPMKRLSLVLLPQERDAVLAGLRGLGVVHLDFRVGTTPEQEAALSRYRAVQEALTYLGKPKVPVQKAPADALEQVTKLIHEVKIVEETLNHWTKRVEFWAPWGDFDPKAVRDLATRGLFLHLYQVPVASFSAYQNLEGVVELNRDKALVRFAVLSRTEAPLEGLVPVPWPEESPSHKAKMADDARKLKNQLLGRLTACSAWVPDLRGVARTLTSQLDWETAKGGVGESDGLAYLTGWVPADRAQGILSLAQEQGVAVLLADPGPEDQPPTQLKNSFFPNLMKPVFELLGVTPGYQERDISWPFFLFFSLFFGMILGDAAYGVILTVLGAVFLVKSLVSGGQGREAWILFTWLGLCTTGWGAVTGTWFATPWDQLSPLLQALVPPLFHPEIAGEAVSNNITVFCFTLGALQLGLASLWNLVKIVGGNPLKAVSHLGWFGLTFGLYLLVLSMVAKASLLGSFFPQPVLGWLFAVTASGPALPNWVLPLILGSYLLILLFSFQEGRFWKGIGEGVVNFLPTSLNAISAFADNISYIRLFAVGLAGYYIEVSFAAMAAGFGMDTPGGVVATVLVLVFGHSLNLVMGFLSVIVHGIRLNVLEFSNRLGMEWSGRPFDPFRAKT